MWREHGGGVPRDRLEPEQAVRVDDGRERRSLQEAAHEIRASSERPSPGPIARRRCAREIGPERLERARVREAALHRLERQRLRHRKLVGRHGDGHVAGVGAKRRGRREHRSAGRARRAAHDEERAGGELRVPGAAARAPARGPPASRGRSTSSPVRARCPRRPRARRGIVRARPRARPWRRGTSPSRPRGPRRAGAPRRSRRRRRRAGRRTAPAGRPPSMRSISAPPPGRGAPWKPVPKSASTTTSAPARSSVSSASRPASRRRRAAIRPSPPFAPLAADDREAPGVREGAERLGGDRRGRALHELVRGAGVARVARLDRAHLVGGVERLVHPSAYPSAGARPERSVEVGDARRRGHRVRVGERDVDVPHPDALGEPERPPESVTPGFGGPTISISFHVNSTPHPSALPTASLPQNRAAYDSAGLRRVSQYACSSAVKQRSRNPVDRARAGSGRSR